jgi:hypothetical protein
VVPAASDLNGQYEITVILICVFMTCAMIIFGVYPLWQVYQAKKQVETADPADSSGDTVTRRLSSLLENPTEVCW